MTFDGTGPVTASIVVLTIETVRVSPQRPENAGKWDGSATEPGNQCGFFGSATAFFLSPAAGMLAKGLCQTRSAKQAERDPQAPDLVLSLQTEDRTYRTPIVRDAFYHDFSYQFIVPVDDAPVHGFKLSVLDQDGDEPLEGELVGLFRLDQRDLGDRSLQRAKAGGVEELVFSVREYEHPQEGVHEVVLDAKTGIQTTSINVMAGELLQIEAMGSYVVSSWDGTTISPVGYPKGKTSYNLNLSPFRTGPHGAAVVIITAGDTAVEGIVVGDCRRFVSLLSGVLSVGINDHDPGNNSGELHFTVRRLAPTDSSPAELSGTCP